jgi:serine/threonine protein kinase
MVEIGTILQDRYLIERHIGAGGMGAVYAAIDQRFESRVAIKETFYTEDELREAFEREARLLNSLHHPVLPHVSDYFTEGNKYFLVMEYIDGEDLSEALKREGGFAVADVMRWTDNLLDALDYLHSQTPPIVHRDIKPQNLKLTPRGDIILLDFGLAKLNTTDTTGVKSVFGYSRKYSPLEQIQGTGTDARSDIFSLGATIYHLLTGKPPIDALARASAIIAGKPDPLPLVNEINQEVPLAAAQILNAALALNADRRFVSAKAARSALEYALNAESVAIVENLPKVIEAAVESKNLSTNTVETENFPALEAFAAAEENSLESKRVEPVVVEVPVQAVNQESRIERQTAAPTAEKRKQSAPRKSPLLTIFATLAALLIWGGMAIWLFGGSSKSSTQPEPQTEQTQTNPTPQPTVENTAILEEPTPEISEPRDTVSETKPKTIVKESAPESKKLSEEAKAEPIEIRNNETPKPAPPNTASRAPVSRPQPAPVNTKPAQRQNVEESRPRVVEPPPASSIEKIMTGEPNVLDSRDARRQRREERRQREQMTDGEKEKLRRQRMDEILRRNRQPVPQD